MNIIKLKVKNFEITPLEKQYVVENQVNEFAIEFEFDDSWNFDTKYVIFDNEENTYKRPIINNQVIIPSELLNGRTTIQIYGQNVEDGEIVKRKPSYKYSFSILNSLSTEGQEESELPTPSQWEVYISQIEDLCNDLQEQFDDLKEDCETKCNDVIERLGRDEQDIQTNTDNIRTNAEAIDKLNTDLLDYSLITETGNKISMSINPNTYVITLSLKDKNDNVLSTQSVDLPLETMIVSASYSNGVLTFTLKNGQTLQVPIGDLISGLVSTDTFNQAVQGLSNRITAIENDYLKSTDKTELQEQITANVHDINNIQEEQLTQNADIESLQQENERLQRIVSGLPTKNASGTSFVLNDMVNCEIKEVALKGDTLQDGTPTPDAPIDIQTVKGNQTIQCCGKNLLKVNNVENTQQDVSISIKNGYITINGTVETGRKLIIENILDSINLQPNSYYLLLSEISGSISNGNARFYLMNENNDDIISATNVNLHDTVTTTEITKCKNFAIYLNSGVTFNNYKIALTLSLYEDVPTSYIPYETSQTKTISLGNIELCKIGNYQDKIYKQNDKWYLEKNTNSIVFDGVNNSFSAYLSYDNFDRLRNDLPNKIISGWYTNQNSDFMVCNYLQNVGQPSSPTANTILAWNNDGPEAFSYFEKNMFSNLQEANEWLTTHNMKIVYAIKTPSITEITDENLINQLEALNNYILLTNNTIISNGNLPVVNDITGYVDIMSLLSTQNNRNVVEENTRKGGEVKEKIEEPIEEPKEEEK